MFYLFFPPMILFCMILIEIVKEKESLLKNYTNLYGLSLVGYWVSWVVVSVIFSGLISLEIVLFGKYIFYYDIFTNTNFFVIFNLFFLFSCSMQFLAMYLSCILSSVRIATTVKLNIIIGFLFTYSCWNSNSMFFHKLCSYLFFLCY